LNLNLSKLGSVLGIIWQKQNNVSIRNKLSIAYTVVFLLFFGGSFTAIYFITEHYRQEEFYQRLKDKTFTTLNLLVEVNEINHEILQIFDKHTINNLYEEKLILFDSKGNVIYTSLDDTKILYPQDILKDLMGGEVEVERDEDKYQLLGVRFNYEGKVYYGINKAYDRFGKSKIFFLKWLLLATFIIVGATTIIIFHYLANFFSLPIRKLAEEFEQIDPYNLSKRVTNLSTQDEVGFLANKFNELLTRVENAFKFQYHFIHHLSHELKTPLAVMMTNTERALSEENEQAYKQSLLFQQKAMMDLANVINAMLDISRMETKNDLLLKDDIRIDEILFECMDELSLLDADVKFDVQFQPQIDDAIDLELKGNRRMLKLAIINLLKNAIQFSYEKMAKIEVVVAHKEISLLIINSGALIEAHEQEQLFHHLFRGKNSEGIKGFGLGLVLVKRIADLHQAIVQYKVLNNTQNCFELRFVQTT